MTDCLRFHDERCNSRATRSVRARDVGAARARRRLGARRHVGTFGAGGALHGPGPVARRLRSTRHDASDHGHEGPRATTVGLEGRLVGPWVDELRACWQSLLAERSAGSLRIDLHGVTFIDAAGKALLRALHEQGAELSATECMTRAIVDEITG